MRHREVALPCDLSASVQVAQWAYEQTEKANGQVWVVERSLRHLNPTSRECFAAFASVFPGRLPVAMVSRIIGDWLAGSQYSDHWRRLRQRWTREASCLRNLCGRRWHAWLVFFAKALWSWRRKQPSWARRGRWRPWRTSALKPPDSGNPAGDNVKWNVLSGYSIPGVAQTLLRVEGRLKNPADREPSHNWFASAWKSVPSGLIPQDVDGIRVTCGSLTSGQWWVALDLTTSDGQRYSTVVADQPFPPGQLASFLVPLGKFRTRQAKR